MNKVNPIYQIVIYCTICFFVLILLCNPAKSNMESCEDNINLEIYLRSELKKIMYRLTVIENKIDSRGK